MDNIEISYPGLVYDYRKSARRRRDASIPWLRSIGPAEKPAFHGLLTGCKDAGGGENSLLRG